MANHIRVQYTHPTFDFRDLRAIIKIDTCQFPVPRKLRGTRMNLLKRNVARYARC